MSAWLLRRLVRLLPERQAGWGEAMEAELAALEGPRERAGFVAGCAWVVLSRPVPGLRAGLALVSAAALAVALLYALTIAAPAGRLVAVAGVVCLLGVAGLLRILLGPAAGDPAVQAVRAAGVAVTLALLAGDLRDLRGLTRPDADLQWVGVHVMVTVLGLAACLAAVLAVTSAGASVARRAVLAGVCTSAAAGFCWLGLTVLGPSYGQQFWPGLVLVLAAGPVAAALAGGQRLSAGLLAVAAAAFVIQAAAEGLVLTGRWVLNAAPPGPGYRLADGVSFLLLGVLAAVLLTVVARGRLSPARASRS